MINPFLTTNQWAMHEPRLTALAEQAKAFVFDPDNDGDDDGIDPGYIVNNGVAVMSLTGPLLKYDDFWCRYFGGTSTLTSKQIFQAALADPDVQATLIIVDSPGGMVAGTVDLADAIAASDKPVWVFISDPFANVENPQKRLVFGTKWLPGKGVFWVVLPMIQEQQYATPKKFNSMAA